MFFAYTIKGTISTETILINLIRMFRDGPVVSLKGSPTVSPITAAACESPPLASPGSLPDSMYFLALSQAPPAFDINNAKDHELLKNFPEKYRNIVVQCISKNLSEFILVILAGLSVNGVFPPSHFPVSEFLDFNSLGTVPLKTISPPYSPGEGPSSMT